MSDLPPPPPPPAPPTSVEATTALPAPPLAGAPGSAQPARTPRAGELASGWRTVFVVAWAGVFLGLASVWKTSRTVGLATWWLGSSSDPRLVVVQVAPFVVPVALLIAAWRRVRWLPLWGALGAVLLAGVAAGDLGGFTRLSVVEFAVAGAAFLVSIASAAGLLRRP